MLVASVDFAVYLAVTFLRHLSLNTTITSARGSSSVSELAPLTGLLLLLTMVNFQNKSIILLKYRPSHVTVLKASEKQIMYHGMHCSGL